MYGHILYTHNVDRRESLRRAVSAHGFSYVSAHMELEHLLNWVGICSVGEEIACSVIERLSPLIATSTACKKMSPEMRKC